LVFVLFRFSGSCHARERVIGDAVHSHETKAFQTRTAQRTNDIQSPIDESARNVQMLLRNDHPVHEANTVHLPLWGQYRVFRKREKFQKQKMHILETVLIFCSTAFFIDDDPHNLRQTRNAIVNELFWEVSATLRISECRFCRLSCSPLKFFRTICLNRSFTSSHGMQS
jgi:hypothetical protein